ncbi:MAG: molecular chaperone HscC [Mobilitalea sp.]
MYTIGIDLGTTNSLVAVWMEGRPIIIPNVFGKNLTPSIFSIDENNEVIVGEAAKERLITHPDCTASCFKRFMGTNKVYYLGGHNFSPEELSSFVLRSLKEDAESFLGEAVTEAVISVPAYFNDKQRKATKKAAELAGFTVERLINEPTAAAIAFGLNDPEQESKFMVFDLGGGTFDVSILEMYDGVMEVHAIAGDNYLGGEDFTELIIEHFLNESSLKMEDLTPKEHSSLYKKAETGKFALVQKQNVVIKMPIKDTEVEVQITPEKYETLCLPLMRRFMKPIERALRDASFGVKDIDNALMIGGATRMPIFRNYVSKLIGKLPYVNINPDEAVALGTAIQAAIKERNEALKEIVLTDVCPYTLGVDILHRTAEGKYTMGHFSPIIERNTVVPVSRVERYVTVSDNQRTLLFEVFQGESRLTAENLKLGEVVVIVPCGKAGTEQADVRFTYDINGILEVEATILSTGLRKRIVIEQNSGQMTNEEIEHHLDSIKNLKIHPRDQQINRLLLERGNRLYEECLGEMRNYLSELMSHFEDVLDGQNELEIRKEVTQLMENLNKLEGIKDDNEE